MKRDLIKQIKNEWRENFWLVLELLIVFLALWFFCMQFYSEIKKYIIPTGADIEDVYSLEIGYADGFSWDADEETKAKYGENMVQLLNRLRNNPNVEAAAFSINGSPFNGSFQGRHVSINDGDTVNLYVNRRSMSPDMVDVLRLESTNGFTRPEMKEALERGEWLLGSNPEYDRQRDVRKILGKQIYGIISDSTQRVVANILINSLRNSRFDKPDYGTAISAINETEVATGQTSFPWEILVRTKHGKAASFLADIDNNPSMNSSGNIYLSEPQSLEKSMEKRHRETMMAFRIKTGGSVCLLLMVFLGLTGTFWYRVRCRESEIAIRKVNGATSSDIFRRLLSEGYILLILAVIIALLAVMVLIYYDVVPGNTVEDIAAGGLAGLIVMLFIVTVGTLFPAGMAMRIQPAEALKSE